MISRSQHAKTAAKIISILILFLFLSPSHAVYVKYRGEVDVSSGRFERLALIPSSLVKELFYSRADKYAVVSLNGTYYHYCRIPEEVIYAWIGSPSLGKFYLQNIKGDFDCRLGGIPKN